LGGKWKWALECVPGGNLGKKKKKNKVNSATGEGVKSMEKRRDKPGSKNKGGAIGNRGGGKESGRRPNSEGEELHPVR